MNKLLLLLLIALFLGANEFDKFYDLKALKEYNKAKEYLTKQVETNPNNMQLKLILINYENELKAKEKYYIKNIKKYKDSDLQKAYFWVLELEKISVNGEYLNIKKEVNKKLLLLKKTALKQLHDRDFYKLQLIMMDIFLYDLKGDILIDLVKKIDSELSKIEERVLSDIKKFNEEINREVTIDKPKIKKVKEDVNKILSATKETLSERKVKFIPLMAKSVEVLEKLLGSKVAEDDKSIINNLTKNLKAKIKNIKSIDLYSSAMKLFKEAKYDKAIEKFNIIVENINYDIKTITNSYIYMGIAYRLLNPKEITKKREYKINSIKSFKNARLFDKNAKLPKEYIKFNALFYFN